jgi:hypothetical protein
MRKILGVLLGLVAILTAGCGFWAVKPDVTTANELLRASCIIDAYYSTGKLPSGAALTPEELQIRLDHSQHVRDSRGLGGCAGVLP